MADCEQTPFVWALIRAVDRGLTGPLVTSPSRTLKGPVILSAGFPTCSLYMFISFTSLTFHFALTVSSPSFVHYCHWVLFTWHQPTSPEMSQAIFTLQVWSEFDVNFWKSPKKIIIILSINSLERIKLGCKVSSEGCRIVMHDYDKQCQRPQIGHKTNWSSFNQPFLMRHIETLLFKEPHPARPNYETQINGTWTFRYPLNVFNIMIFIFRALLNLTYQSSGKQASWNSIRLFGAICQFKKMVKKAHSE